MPDSFQHPACGEAATYKGACLHARQTPAFAGRRNRLLNLFRFPQRYVHSWKDFLFRQRLNYCIIFMH